MTTRVLLQSGTAFRHLCTIVFNRRDGSLYMFPFGNSSQYFYGKWCLPAGVMQQQFNYTTQFRSTRVPKVSVHATGWVQIEESTGSNTVGPLYIPELAKLEDAIVTTISVTDVAKLRTKDRPVGTDLLIAGNVSQGLTALVYINHEPEFRRRFSRGARLVVAKLPGTKNTMYLGVELLAAKPSTGDEAPAFELLVGLDPRHQPGAEKEMLFIVGQ